MYRYVIVVICFFFCSHSFAKEFYSFVDKKCKHYSGLAVRVSEMELFLWKLDGTMEVLHREDIASIFVFNTAKYPFSSMGVSAALRPFLRKVTFGRGEEKKFIGWPYKFVEELVFFLSTKGKDYVLSLDQIQLVENVAAHEKVNFRAKDKTSVKLNLALYLPECLKSNDKGSFLRPHRVIIDKIKIFEFLKNLEDGFNRIGNFEERTRLYARPFLFRQARARFAINTFKPKKGVEYRAAELPVYFQWTTGSDFHFQSQSSLGSKYQEWLPNVEPMLTLTSDLKSHFFNALFIGNLSTLPTGTAVSSKLTKENKEEKTRVTPHLNYLTLMGGDWREFSFSIGRYSPSYILQVKKDMREVLSTTTSPMLRFQYIKEKIKLRLLYAQTDYDYSSANPQRDVQASGEVFRETEGDFGRLTFSSRFIRVGIDYDIDEDTTVGLDEIFLTGKYQEELDSLKNFIDFKHFYTTAYVQKDLGHYVFLRVVGNHYIHDYNYKMGRYKDSKTERIFKTGVIFGLLF